MPDFSKSTPGIHAETSAGEASILQDIEAFEHVPWAEIQEGYEMMYRDLGGEEKVLQMLEEEKKALAEKLFPKAEEKANIFDDKDTEEHLNEMKLK